MLVSIVSLQLSLDFWLFLYIIGNIMSTRQLIPISPVHLVKRPRRSFRRIYFLRPWVKVSLFLLVAFAMFWFWRSRSIPTLSVTADSQVSPRVWPAGFFLNRSPTVSNDDLSFYPLESLSHFDQLKKNSDSCFLILTANYDQSCWALFQELPSQLTQIPTGNVAELKNLQQSLSKVTFFRQEILFYNSQDNRSWSIDEKDAKNNLSFLIQEMEAQKEIYSTNRKQLLSKFGL